MAVKLRGHAKRHPPPSLPLFPSLFLLRPLSSTPRRLRGFFLSTRFPSPPLPSWTRAVRVEIGKRNFEGRKGRSRDDSVFFSRSRGVKWGSRRERTGLRSFLSIFWHVEAYYGEVWMGASVDGFSSACAFSARKEGFVWGDMNTTIGASYANCTSESGKEEVVSVFNRGPSN